MNDGFGVDISLLSGQVHHFMMGWFTGVLAAGLTTGLIIILCQPRRCARERALREATRDSSAAASDGDTASPVPFGSPAMAALAAAHENTACWQQLLAAFAAAIEAEGYTFGTDERAKVALPHATRARAGVAVVAARARYISPLQSESEREAFLQQAAEDGYTGCWADWCHRGAGAAGWYVIRREVNDEHNPDNRMQTDGNLP